MISEPGVGLVLVSETMAKTFLELGDVISSALHPSSHKRRLWPLEEAVGVHQSSIGSGQKWTNSSQFCTEFCHLKFKPTVCVSTKVFSPSFYASVSTGEGRGEFKGTKSGIITETNHNVPKKSMITESYKISTQVRHPGSQVALTAKLWISLPLAEFEQIVSKNVNERKWAWYVQRQGLRGESGSLLLKRYWGGDTGL